MQDAETQFVIGGMQIDHQTALQARLDPVLEVLDLARCAVGGNDDLLVAIHKGVERVEEFFLRAVLAGDELHVIHHQHIDGAKDLLEFHHLAVAQRLHETVHELFRGQIDHVQVGPFCLQLPCDGMHQVGLAQTDAPIEEQGVERNRPAFGDATRGGMGQFVRLAHDETVKGKAPVQGCAGQLVGCKGGHGGGLGQGCRHRFDRRALGRVGCNAEVHAAHDLPGFGQLMQDQVTKVLRDVVAEEIGRDMECGDTFRDIGELQRLNPVGIVVLAHSAEKFPLQLSPLFLCHFSPSPTCSIPQHHKTPGSRHRRGMIIVAATMKQDP